MPQAFSGRPVVESWLYPSLDGLHTVEVRDSGTWVSLTLTDALTVRDALEEWEDQANASGDLVGTYNFSFNDPTTQDYPLIEFRITAGAINFDLRINSASLRSCLGFTTATQTGSPAYTTDTRPLGIAKPFNAGFAAPVARSEVETWAARWGRFKQFTAYRGRLMRCEFFFTSYDELTELLAGPLFAGKLRFDFVGSISAAHYGNPWPTAAGQSNVTDLDGHVEAFHPIEISAVERTGFGDEHGRLEVLGLLEDSTDADPAVFEGYTSSSATGFALIASGLPYGWRIMYALEVEGIPHHFVESSSPGFTAETGYTVEPSLVVDASSKIGSVVDKKQGIGKGFDLSVQIERNATTLGLFKRPTNLTYLTADLDYNATASATVKSTTGFASSGTFYVGTEAVKYTGTTATTFTTLTRGAPNGDWRGYDHPISSSVSTWVTDSPLFWRGRIARLWAIPIDPYGNHQGATLLADAAPIWQGYVQTDPEPDRTGWTLNCRSVDRRLTDKVGSSATGKATIASGAPDYKITIDDTLKAVTINIEQFAQDNWSPDAEFDFRPFRSLSVGTSVELSRIRALIASEWAVNAVGAEIDQNKFRWYTANPHPDIYEWHAQFFGRRETAAGSGKLYTWVKMQPFNLGWLWVAGYPRGNREGGGKALSLHHEVSDTTRTWLDLGLVMQAARGPASLRITLDKEDPNNLPTSGWMIVQGGDDNEAVFKYTAITVDTDGTVIPEFDRNIGPDFQAWAAPRLQAGYEEAQGLSVRFAVKDEGKLRDTMRRMLMSSGRGDNDGTYDTLPQSGGMDIADVNTAAFDTVFDAEWDSIAGSMILDEARSFVDIYGGLVGLSRRAIVPIPGASAVDLTPVRTSLADSAVGVVTITDSHLVVAGSGGTSVSLQGREIPPNSVAIEINRTGKEGPLGINDLVAMRAEGVKRWTVKTHGIGRQRLAGDGKNGPAIAWAQSLFQERFESPLIELDVVPWLDVETGDAVQLELDHFALWNRATGAAGYTGPGRVLGNQINLQTGVRTLTVQIAGVYSSLSLAPSAEILAQTGSPPGVNDTIDIDADYYDLMLAYLASADPFKLIRYSAGSDGATNGYTFDAVTLPGNCRLTIASVVGSPPSTVGDFLTLPKSTDGSSTAQDKHLHTDSSGARWL